MLEEFLSPMYKLFFAAALAMPVAWHREKNSRIVGLRTFPLVAVGACAYLLIGLDVFGQASEANARLLQGLMTGIGFVGGGAILKHDDHVSGTASAASIWVTGAIGASVAYELYPYAVALAAVNFLVVMILSRVKSDAEEDC